MDSANQALTAHPDKSAPTETSIPQLSAPAIAGVWAAAALPMVRFARARLIEAGPDR